MTNATRPNILLITCHDLGRFLGCYGITTVRTPNLDALAAGGARCSRAFSTASGCSPARGALATGRYPHANGVMGLTHPPFGWDLKPDEQHIAQLLGAAGYDTHLFGFQHVSPHDARPGFAHVHVDHNRGLADPVASKVCDLLAGWNQERPLYLEVNLEEPHRPYDQGGSVPDDSLGVTVPGYLPPGPETREEIAALQGAVGQADRAVGRIMAGLEAAGQAPNTLVLFLVDHGLAMPRAKCTLYDPGIEIALLLRWPEGGFGAGGVIDDLISNVDVLPTLLEAAGVPVPERVQGRSFLARLRGEPYTPRTAVFAEKTYHSYYDPMRAIRTERFKYIRNDEPAFLVEVPGDVARGAIFRAHVELYYAGEHPPAELYDLEADPLEMTNLAGRPEVEQVQADLEARLLNWQRETGDPLLDGPIPTPGFVAADADAGRPASCSAGDTGRD